MFIVITGLDGTGTSSIAEELHKRDNNSILVRTPSYEYNDRQTIDENVRELSPMAHCLYYLSSVVFMSDKIQKMYDYKNNNVYCVRYLIDTVVSNSAAGIDIPFNYNVLGKNILKPDLTIFVYCDEDVRQSRIGKRGKDSLDTVLDNVEKRQSFMSKFDTLLDSNNTIFVNNNEDLEIVVDRCYNQIMNFKKEIESNEPILT